MNSFNAWIERHLRRLAWGRFLQRSAEALAIFLFVFGTAVLATKLLLPSFWPHVLWLAVAAVPVTGAAWWLSRQNRFTRSESVAMLDRRLDAGGLLMTLAETPDELWTERLPHAEQVWQDGMPKIRPVRFFRHLSLPVVFAVGACFVPIREAVPEPVLPSTVGQQVSAELEEMLDWLQDARVLEDKEERELREEIDKLAEEAKDTPLTHEKWETVDALRERMQLRLETAALSTAKAYDAVAALTKAGAEGEELGLEESLRLEKNLAESLQKLAENGAFSGASQELQDQLERLVKNGEFKLPTDPAERQQLLDDLQDFLDKEWDELAELRKQCNGGNCPDCEDGLCPGGSACPGGKRGANSGQPGRGGVTRGRGDAPLTYGDESNEQGTKFKEVVLPPGFKEDPKDEVLRVTRSAPEEEPVESAARGQQRQFDPSAGKETWNRRLRPRHREVVRGYFDSK